MGRGHVPVLGVVVEELWGWCQVLWVAVGGSVWLSVCSLGCPQARSCGCPSVARFPCWCCWVTELDTGLWR